MTTDALLEKLEACLAEAGVTTYVCIASNPDTDTYGMVRKGSVLWAIGALDYHREACIRRHREETDEGS